MHNIIQMKFFLYYFSLLLVCVSTSVNCIHIAYSNEKICKLTCTKTILNHPICAKNPKTNEIKSFNNFCLYKKASNCPPRDLILQECSVKSATTKETTPEMIQETTPEMIEETTPEMIQETTPEMIQETTPEMIQETTIEEVSEEEEEVTTSNVSQEDVTPSIFSEYEDTPTDD